MNDINENNVVDTSMQDVQDSIVSMKIEENEVLDIRIKRVGDHIEASELRRFNIDELDMVENQESLLNPAFIPMGNHNLMLNNSDIMLESVDQQPLTVTNDASLEHKPSIFDILETERKSVELEADDEIPVEIPESSSFELPDLDVSDNNIELESNITLESKDVDSHNNEFDNLETSSDLSFDPEIKKGDDDLMVFMPNDDDELPEGTTPW